MFKTGTVEVSNQALPVRELRPRTWTWVALVAVVALIPFLPGLTGGRVFYVRDLSSYFWGRYLWLRRAWLSGQWPLWDPYVGGGQAAYSDALHQMFLPPAVLARLIGGEVLGFNLWVALPFPICAAGAWAFLARRFSAPAAALGAIAFTLCGPTVATSDFPNFSWSVAALPWVLWATDRLVCAQTARNVAALAIVVASQALAGEPVTLFTTLVLAFCYAFVFWPWTRGLVRRLAVRCALFVGGGAILGVALAAIQVVPMVSAAFIAGRADTIVPDLWSLRPTALIETVWPHLFGNYFSVQSLDQLPWMTLMYTGREPLLFSIYFGVPLLTLAVFGLAGTGARRDRLFWVAAGFISIVASFGSYTPIYPILRDHVPPFGYFRFPVKYIVVGVAAVAAGAAMGWDGLAARCAPLDPVDERRVSRAWTLALALPVTIGALAGLFAAACAFAPARTAVPLEAFAARLGDASGRAAPFLLRTAPRGAVSVVLVAMATAAVWALVRARREGTYGVVARWTVFSLVAGDLLFRAWGVNPAFDAAHLAEPAWLSHLRADPNARFYVGGKLGCTLESMDVDSSRGYLNAPGLTGSASRAALNIEAAGYPSAWHVREMVSCDLPDLWPHQYEQTTERFEKSTAGERDRFLDRTGVRYRVLPERRAAGRTPIMPIPQFYESFLFDWGPVTPRASVVPDAEVVPDVKRQVAELFRDGWDARGTVLIAHALAATGTPGAAVNPYATFLTDTPNRVVLDAGAGASGGYLVLLDSYSEDWRVAVDDRPASMVRADGLFRAVRLTAGRHTVEFTYRPRALAVGTVVSGTALLSVSVLILAGRKKRAEVERRTREPELAAG